MPMSEREKARLEETLRQDFQSQNDVSQEEVLYAARLLAEQDNDADADRAWAQFQEKYRPFLTDGRSLYEEAPAPASPPVRKRRFRIRAIGIAAVLAAALTVAAAAAGYGMWDGFFKHTKDDFQFTEVPATDPADIVFPEEKDFASLQEAIEAYGFTQRVLPRWVPERFALHSVIADGDRDSYWLHFQALYQQGDDGVLVIGCDTTLGSDTDKGAPGRFQTDEGEPEVYEAGGIPHFLMTNAGRAVALWVDGAMECFITGDVTQDELIRMIDSLYEE